MGKKSSKAPDVVGAAREEGEMSRETARDTTYADRPDQFTPFGSTNWYQHVGIDPATGEPVTKWVQNHSLDPTVQNIFDNQLAYNDQNAYMAAQMGYNAMDTLSQPHDWDQFGDVIGFDPDKNRARAEDAMYQKFANRLDNRFGSQRDSLEVQLANRGLRPGDQAYDAAMRNFGTERNDAYENAMLQSIASGRDEYGLNLQTNQHVNALRDQRIQEYLGKRSIPLDERQRLMDTMTVGEMADTYGGA